MRENSLLSWVSLLQKIGRSCIFVDAFLHRGFLMENSKNLFFSPELEQNFLAKQIGKDPTIYVYLQGSHGYQKQFDFQNSESQTTREFFDKKKDLLEKFTNVYFVRKKL